MIDKELLNALKPAKLRNKATPSRPRPKTIHVDAGSELDSGALTPARGKKGSSSNLSTGKLHGDQYLFIFLRKQCEYSLIIATDVNNF